MCWFCVLSSVVSGRNLWDQWAVVLIKTSCLSLFIQIRCLKAQTARTGIGWELWLRSSQLSNILDHLILREKVKNVTKNVPAENDYVFFFTSHNYHQPNLTFTIYTDVCWVFCIIVGKFFVSKSTYVHFKKVKLEIKTNKQWLKILDLVSYFRNFRILKSTNVATTTDLFL